jgi:subtilisin-like proprotein convertase family protein
MKKSFTCGIVLTSMLVAAAQHAHATDSGTISAAWSGNRAILDNDATGTAFSFEFVPSNPLTITDVTVDLTMAGGWNGDLYAYLSHGSGFCVLLNRIGSASSNPFGSSAGGMNVTFSEAYPTDIHTSPANPLNGNFAPDARNVSPFHALDSDPQTAFLNSFTGLDPSGTWTLFFADVAPGLTSAIRNWSVNVGVATVPEPSTAALVGVTLALGVARRLRRSR